MNMEMITPVQRLGRMRESFGISESVLAEDYLYFTTPITPHASWLIPLSQVDLDVVLRPGRAAARGGDGWLYGQGAVAFPIPADLFRRGALRRVPVRTAMAGWICLPQMRRPRRGGAEEP